MSLALLHQLAVSSWIIFVHPSAVGLRKFFFFLFYFTGEQRANIEMFLSRTICWTFQSVTAKRPDGSYASLVFSSSGFAPICGRVVLSNHIYTIIIYYTRKSADWMFFLIFIASRFTVWRFVSTFPDHFRHCHVVGSFVFRRSHELEDESDPICGNCFSFFCLRTSTGSFDGFRLRR